MFSGQLLGNSESRCNIFFLIINIKYTPEEIE